MAQAVRPAAPDPLVFIDTFTRADEPLDASGNWTLPVDGSVVSVVNNRAQSTGSNNTGFAQVVQDVGVDRYIEMNVRCLTAADSRNAELYIRMGQGNTQGYIFRTRRNGNWQMGLRPNPEATLQSLLDGSAGNLGENYTARFEVVGHTLKGYLNGVLVGELTIPRELQLTSGRSGFQIQPPGTNRPSQTLTRFETGTL